MTVNDRRESGLRLTGADLIPGECFEITDATAVGGVWLMSDRTPANPLGGKPYRYAVRLIDGRLIDFELTRPVRRVAAAVNFS